MTETAPEAVEPADDDAITEEATEGTEETGATEAEQAPEVL